MHIEHSSYKKYTDSISEKLVGEKLFSPLLLNEETIVFPLMDEKHKSLVISLNSNTPLVYVINDDHFFSSIESKKIQKLRKLFAKSILKELHLDDNDNIVYLTLYNFESFETYKLIVELIKNRPNLIVLKEEKIIEQYFHYKSRNLEFGNTYQKPAAIETQKDGIKLDESLIEDIHKKQYEIRQLEKYRLFRKYINSKITLNKRKISHIQNDVESATKNLEYEEIANEILSLGLNLKSHQKEVELEKGALTLNEAKTVYENVESFYKKAKKAKETIKRSKANIDNALKELNEYEEIIRRLDSASEKEADELVSLYGQNNKKKEIKETIFNRPYKLNLNGTIIYFGRNASQNDYLSFVMKLDREFTWLHIKDKSGAHLVIANTKPTENELLFACEISLLCSRATSGEVVYTKKKNVRRGHTLGEAILKNHSTIKLNNIRKETIDAFATAKRVD